MFSSPGQSTGGNIGADDDDISPFDKIFAKGFTEGFTQKPPHHGVFVRMTPSCVDAKLKGGGK